MLSFICGTDETSKVHEIYRLARQSASTGKSVFILVPEQYSMYAEQELISALGLSAQNKIQVLTFSRLCNLIFSKMGPLRTKYMDKAGKYIITGRALRMCRNDLMFFKRNVSQHGFTGLIMSAISEFKRYGVSPDVLKSTAENCKDDRLRLKLHDLSIIYEKFNSLLEANHSNSEDNLSLIVPKIPEADFLSGVFYINFFKSFTPSEYAVLSALMTKTDLCVSLCTPTLHGKSQVFSSQINTYQKLCSLAKENGVSVLPAKFIDNGSSVSGSADLDHLRDNFFSASPQSFMGKPEHIHILRPDNYHGEVTACAALIKRLVRERGYSFNDFLVLTGDITSYQLLIPPIFAEFGISYFLDCKTPIAESPFMRMVISVLEILAYGFSYDRVIKIARSGFFPVSKEETDMFENYILASDITHAHWQNRDAWSYNPDKHMFDMDRVNAIKSCIVHPLLDLADKFSGRKTTKTICNNLYEWLTELDIPTIVSDKIDLYKNASMPNNAQELQMVWNSFVSVTNQICDHMGEDFCTFEEFYQIFVSACGELSVGTIPPTQDKIIISPVDLFRSTGNKVVILLGANDGVFPRDYSTEGIISDSERVLLADAGLTLAPDTYQQQQEEQFLIYSVFAAAKSELYIFSPLSNREGKGLKPSEIIHTLSDVLFPDINSCTEDLSSELIFAESREAAFQQLMLRLFDANWDRSHLSPVFDAVLSYLQKDPVYEPRIARLHQMHLAKSKSDTLSTDVAKRLYGYPLVLSVSKLEKYNACAFSFFMKYGLFAQERLLGGLKSTDTGNILHNVLCTYFKDKSKKNADYSKIQREECINEISALVDTLGSNANENLYTTSHYYKYMMLRIKNIASSTAWKLINFYSQSSFRPTGFEVSFGEHGTYPPYPINSKHGEVYLKGFIDRVDSAETEGKTYLAITDYKSSERQLDMTLAEAGVHFQPLVYANALTKHSPDATVAAMFYLQMNDPMLKFADTPTQEQWEKGMTDNIKAHGIILDDNEVLAAIDRNFEDKDAIHYIKCDKKSLFSAELMTKVLYDAEVKATETADNILEGKISVNPAKISGFDACEYCPYSSICQEQ